MRNEEFISVCDAVQHGSERHVMHAITHKSGTVLSCSGDFLEVDCDGEHNSWSKEDVREVD